MGQPLTEIARKLRDAPKKVQLIYAFNGTGKTRLSREFKKLIAPKEAGTKELAEAGAVMLYYNAFTEDLFYWDNDLNTDLNRKLKIQQNNFTKWILENQGQENNIITHFQRYTNDKLTPRFNEQYNEIIFSIASGNNDNVENIKISKGEESCLIWCVFYSLLEQVIEVLNVSEPNERETSQFNDLKYVFIDDPVSSLDDTHLIELAVNIADLIKSSTSALKFIITTHNPLFYNVLFNEFNNKDSRYGYQAKHCVKKRFEKLNDGTFILDDQPSDSPFSYHLFLLSELDKAIKSGNVQKYHFNFLRNILEKTSTFLGYAKWRDLLPAESREAYYNRIINLSSHGKFSSEEVSIIEDNDKRVLSYLIKEIRRIYGFKENITNNETEGNDTV